MVSLPNCTCVTSRVIPQLTRPRNMRSGSALSITSVRVLEAPVGTNFQNVQDQIVV